ncbi:MAG: hypothetical protein E6R03_18525 [Hyphomicrobiaceae bacterium]|nr:MAG: hypothetical protein E6R03_18525 [Hyphomicrobiaceae bacterium]
MRHRTCFARTTFFTSPDRACRRLWPWFDRADQERALWWRFPDLAPQFLGVDFAQPGNDHMVAFYRNSEGQLVEVSASQFYDGSGAKLASYGSVGTRVTVGPEGTTVEEIQTLRMPLE